MGEEPMRVGCWKISSCFRGLRWKLRRSEALWCGSILYHHGIVDLNCPCMPTSVWVWGRNRRAKSACFLAKHCERFWGGEQPRRSIIVKTSLGSCGCTPYCMFAEIGKFSSCFGGYLVTASISVFRIWILYRFVLPL